MLPKLRFATGAVLTVRIHAATPRIEIAASRRGARSLALGELCEDGLLERAELGGPLLCGGVLFGVRGRLAQQEQLADLVDLPVDLPVADEETQGGVREGERG